MAGKLSATLLGIEDVKITDRDLTLIDYKVNKIGGKPVRNNYLNSSMFT